MWDLLEPYFREITLHDFEALEPKFPFNSCRVDPCFLIPFVGSGKQFERKVDLDPSDVSVVAENSSLNSVLGKKNKELDNDTLDSKPDTHKNSYFVAGKMELVSNNRTNVEHCGQDMQEVILPQEEQPMEILRDQGTRVADVIPDCRDDLGTSLNWLLGSKGRFVLTSERPNKKRKLLGADAGLECLVLLPPLKGETGQSCDVCCLQESDASSNRMLHCNTCKVLVHQKCYGVQAVPDGQWICSWCNSVRLERRLTRSDTGRAVAMPCMLCPKEKGALKPVTLESGRTADGCNLNFVHLFCSLWAPEVLVEDMELMEPITNIGNIQEKRTKMVCSLCKIMHGACIRCSHGTCRTCFHPICARESKHQMEIWGKFGDTNVELRAFCSKHSTSRDISSLHNDNGVVARQTTQVELDDGNLITDKKQQVRFTRTSNGIFMNDTSVSSSSSSLKKGQTTELVTVPSITRSVENQQIQSTDIVIGRTTGDGNLMGNSGDVSTVLRKVIEQGKVNVGYEESELGLSTEYLETALVPETTTFSSGLKLLQNSVHVPSVKVKSQKEDFLAPQGTLLRSESKILTDSPLVSELEEDISSFDHCFTEDGRANKDWSDLVENCLHNCRNCEEDAISGRAFLNFDGCSYYIHPFIKKMLQAFQVHILNRNEQTVCYHEEFSCPPHGQNHSGSSTKFEQLTNIAAADQVSKIESSCIPEHSLHDEIEGEIVHLQSKLLNDVAAMHRRYEDVIFKVVQSLSHEMDSFNKRKWDHIITNQFLRDMREAKKRGNTERRHKEAQAILAAAAPFVTFTSRNAEVKKVAENVVSTKQESIPKVNAGSSRVSQLTLLPQAKDPSFANCKVSSDADFGIFDLAKFSKKNGFLCGVCMRPETVLNRIFLCSSCKAAVHLDCYRNPSNATGPWHCELCQEMLSDAVISGSQPKIIGTKSCLVQCVLCHGMSGAFRKTTKGQWVHAFCAEWLLESTFRRGQYNAVHGMENLPKGKDTCCICDYNVGACLKCSTAGCQVPFHPACARDAGFHMNTKKHGSSLRHKAYCGNHSIEQRKVDSQQYGPAEVKIMKQMRVELERLRLLCDRIVKREKEKKELVECEHDILAAKKDSVVRASCYTSGPGPGASSESATTSVNNNSYSGKRQRSDDVTVRSDDITVDSTISRKHVVRFSMHSKDTDRNTADSSTSTISYKLKLDDGESLAVTNLQEREAVTSQKSEDGETKSAEEKHGETCQKELIMSADKAISQKQQPAKRFVYTRRSSLSKKMQQSQDALQGPGGG